MTTCAAGFDAAKGTLPAQYETLFRDLLRASTTESGAPNFLYDTCDITSPLKPYLLGIEGLGFTRSEKHQAVLTDFAQQYGQLNFNDGSTQRRLVRALFLTGSSDAAQASLRSLLDVTNQADSFKPETLKYLATWKSSSATDYCMDTLRTGKGPKEACIWYLGEMRHRDAYDVIVRRMEDEEEAALRALGHMGDPRGIPILEKKLQTTRSVQLRTATLVALMNLGKNDLFPEFERVLQGRRFLPSGTEVARTDVRLVETATFEALELEDEELRARSLKAVANLGDLEGQSAKAWRVPVVLSAAQASLGDPDAITRLGTLLDDPRKDVRHLVVRLIGANFDQLRGLRVSGRSLFAPLTRAYEMEPDVGKKHAMTLAAAYMGATP